MKNGVQEFLRFAIFFALLPESYRKIVRFLSFIDKKNGGSCFPTVERIARACKISARTVQRFFSILKTAEKFLTVRDAIIISKRKNGRGGDSSNLYQLHPDLKKALEWLDIHGKLRMPKKQLVTWILSMENEQKCHPQTEKVSPLISPKKDSSINKQTSGTVWMPAALLKSNIDNPAKLWAVKNASEHLIQETGEACAYQEREIHKRGGKILNPSAYFLGVLKNKMRQQGARL
jgi:helix-turn-helix protein